ncbi:uncharacterized protein PHACADRAFT_33288 [Phanerochaete carnosa HHB-10118-sp]|uniref:Major facilitator superfamily (MFS) profile domain-containing protein n=1 Tax=Phanerochaete carnosa (strain HHB-10118-sp) TaxID=650164 RepID=K5VSH6_PHACS|nr:uncharacterized protein PHACADRAFT_33288 [Phanerochaete carnosa HHB-10118-sp]EKM49725.1 hypothetical protein PHACADRAFT_33288 [Phanerochaete carnosa HHB-10118-sp]
MFEDDICRSPIVQKAYSKDIIIYTTVSAVLSVVLAGPYGRVSDIRGRKRALTISATLNALGNVWLVLCSFFATLRSPWLVQLAAVLQGLGGGFSIITAIQNAAITDTSAPSELSLCMGRTYLLSWISIIIGLGISANLLDVNLYVTNFGTNVLIWLVYLLYLHFVVREVRVPPAEDNADVAAAAAPGEATTYQSIPSRLLAATRSVFEPMTILARHTTLLFLSIAIVGTTLSIGVFSLIIPYCDTKFGLEPSEAGLITAAWSVSRAVIVVFLLPMFLAAYQWLAWLANWKRPERKPASVHIDVAADETAPLLVEATQEPQADENTQTTAPSPSASKRLAMIRICLMVSALGMLATESSRNVGEVALGLCSAYSALQYPSDTMTTATVASSFGTLAVPFMQALLTLAAPPGATGRVLAGLSILQSAAIALRGLVFVTLFDVTLEKASGAVWWLSAVSVDKRPVESLILALSSLVMFSLRPKQFVSHSVLYADGPSAAHFDLA